MANSHLRCWCDYSTLLSHIIGVNSNFRRNSTQLICSARLANNAWSMHSSVTSQC